MGASQPIIVRGRRAIRILGLATLRLSPFALTSADGIPLSWTSRSPPTSRQSEPSAAAVTRDRVSFTGSQRRSPSRPDPAPRSHVDEARLGIQGGPQYRPLIGYESEILKPFGEPDRLQAVHRVGEAGVAWGPCWWVRRPRSAAPSGTRQRQRLSASSMRLNDSAGLGLLSRRHIQRPRRCVNTVTRGLDGSTPRIYPPGVRYSGPGGARTPWFPALTPNWEGL
jgi:hypothetical protein